MEALAAFKFQSSIKIHKSEILSKKEEFEIFRQTKSNKCPYLKWA